jgi:hypothetical protein
MRHYSEVDIERLHGDDGARLIRPLRLAARERADLVSFLQTLSSPVGAAHGKAGPIMIQAAALPASAN